MTPARASFPFPDVPLLLTDGGLETTLIYKNGHALPHFASFVLLDDIKGREDLRRYYDAYLSVAREHGAGLLLDTPTWRASADWGERLGYDEAALRDINLRAAQFLAALCDRLEGDQPPVAIGGSLGPRGDGYSASECMTPAQSEEYHTPQVEALREGGVDFLSALTLTTAAEAIGIARAAQSVRMPAVLSFTVETDGSLPDGASLAETVDAVDTATDCAPAFYMVNCAHPSHFAHCFETDASWTSRIGGLRVNSSKLSHEDLEASTDLDEGNPDELGREIAALCQHLPEARVFGGCCGTSPVHIGAMARKVRARQAAPRESD